MAGVRFPAGARKCPLLHNVQTGSGAHPTSYPMGTGDFSSWCYISIFGECKAVIRDKNLQIFYFKYRIHIVHIKFTPARRKESVEIVMTQGGKDKRFPSLLEFIFCQQKVLCGLTNVGRGQA
jgi:hypothetical protein